MRVTRLVIENFLMIGTAEAGLEDRGLVLVQGENHDDTSQDSNGSGKSSFPDAISWAIYGFTARGESGDQVVNRTAKKNCRVQIEVEDGPDVYRITRYRKHSKHKNGLFLERLEGESSKDLTLGTNRLTQSAVARIMGCSEEVFRAAVYMGQEQMPDLPGMTDKQLKLLIEEAAGIDKLGKGYEIARRRLGETSRKIELLEGKIDSQKSLTESLESQLSSTQEKSAEWDSEQKARIQEKTRALKEQKKITDSLDPSVQVRQEELQEELARIDKAIGGVSGERVREQELSKALDASKSEAMKREEALRSGARALKEAKESMERSVHESCDKCGRPYTHEIMARVKAKDQERYDKARNRANDLSKAFKGAKAASETASQALESFRASMTNIDAEIAAQRKTRASLAQVDNELSEQNDAKKRLKDIAMELRRQKDATNPYLEMVDSTKERLEQALDGVSKAREELEAFEEELVHRKVAASAFGPSGVRAHILDTVTPFLNDRTAHYLGALSDGNISALWQTLTPKSTGELSEKFSISASSRVGSLTFRGLSGGEKRKVRLSCAMALQDLVSSRATKPIELFVADEIDDSVDQSGHERLMGILEEKSRDKGTVLVISHNDLSDWIRQVVTVSKEGGSSTVLGESLKCR